MFSNLDVGFTFKGSVDTFDDLPLTCNKGDVYYVNKYNTTSTTVTWSGMDWVDIVNSPEPRVEYKKTKPQICKCCGAPLYSFKCEYCGVEYD